MFFPQLLQPNSNLVRDNIQQLQISSFLFTKTLSTSPKVSLPRGVFPRFGGKCSIIAGEIIFFASCAFHGILQSSKKVNQKFSVWSKTLENKRWKSITTFKFIQPLEKFGRENCKVIKNHPESIRGCKKMSSWQWPRENDLDSWAKYQTSEVYGLYGLVGSWRML